MQPTLLVGPADWDAARMPEEEFLARVAALWRRVPSAAGAVVYGDRAHHAELAYLTGFTPKLEAAIALIPRSGAPRLLVGGGINMLPAARPLTYVEDLRPLRQAGGTVAQWAREQGGAPVLIGGARMSWALHREIAGTLEIEDRTADLRALMRRKSARELALIRAACATLDAAVGAAADAQRRGAGASAAVLAGEHAAHRRGAQDVRTLSSLDQGRSLRPFEVPVERAIDPLPVYVAVRQFGYWAEGFAALTASSDPGAAGDVLRSAVAMIRPGARCSEVARVIAQRIPRPHPVTARSQGNAIGLALEEQPLIAAEGDDTFEAGEVFSLRVGVSDGRRHAIVSAMVAVEPQGGEVLWSSPGGAR